MRIALVSEHANPLARLGGADAGGQNVHVAAVAAGLTRRGHDVTVYTRRDDAAAPDHSDAPEGYRVELVPAGPPRVLPKDDLLPHMPAFADWLAQRWQHERFDVVHAHFWMSGIATLSAGRRVGVPVLQTFHALGTVKRRHQRAEDTSPDARLPMERRLAREVDGIIATCSDEVAELREMGMPPGRAHVIPCGVDTDVFRPVEHQPQHRARHRAAVGPGTPYQLLSLGRLVPRKGVQDVIAALPQLPDAELVVAGGPPPEELDDDPEIRRLRAAAADQGVAARVHFTGALDRDAVAPLMCASDVVVCAPWYEPFGIVPVEAMACGRPVVGTAVGGLLDTVQPGRTGELVPPRRPDRLATEIQGLLDDPDRRECYSRAARHRASRHYRWDQVVAETEAAYQRVLHSGQIVPAEVAQ
jgi:glycosyltransferase involved in cell wall biosynthesis